MNLSLPAVHIRRGLLTIAAAITLVSLGSALIHPGSHGLARLIDVDAESNIPTWYASLGLAASSILLATSAWIEGRSQRRGFLAHWLFLSVTFAMLSIDEFVGLHEMMGTVLHRHVHLTGFLRFVWVIPACLGLGLFGLGYIRFLAALPPRLRTQFVAAGAVYVIGAVGMEMIGGKLFDLYPNGSVAYLLSSHLEEFLEFCGIALFNAALIEHLAEQLGPEGLRLRFSRD